MGTAVFAALENEIIKAGRFDDLIFPGFPPSLDQFAMTSSVASRVLSIKASMVGSGMGTAIPRCVPQRLTFACIVMMSSCDITVSFQPYSFLISSFHFSAASLLSLPEVANIST
jgi:hypothetical protein